jgi:type IV secretory pathway VirB3-like protein
VVVAAAVLVSVDTLEAKVVTVLVAAFLILWLINPVFLVVVPIVYSLAAIGFLIYHNWKTITHVTARMKSYMRRTS